MKYSIMWSYFYLYFTWSCTSPSQSSRHKRFSSGLHRDSLKWEWGSSWYSPNKVVTNSWMQFTAFLDMLWSRWQAAWKESTDNWIFMNLPNENEKKKIIHQLYQTKSIAKTVEYNIYTCIYFYSADHYIDVTWAPWHLKSPSVSSITCLV